MAEPDASTLLSKITLPALSEAEKALNAQPLPAGAVDLIKVYKSQRLLVLMRDYKEVRRYYVRLGHQPVGAKTVEGDSKTPEGLYIIDRRKPDSAFHLGLHISYPNGDDIARARSLHKAPGGEIFIHGLPYDTPWVNGYHRRMDWTNGCIAVSDPEIEEIYRAVGDGTPIRILP